MKKIIIYYSHTGNNALLAENVAEKLGIDSFRLTETKPRTTKSIITDMMFSRSSKFTDLPADINKYDLIIFMGPIWMYHIPSPLKAYFNKVKKEVNKYAYISLSGGALGPNTKVASELVKRLGKGLTLNLDLNIANFCTTPETPTTDDTGEYLLDKYPVDLEKLTSIAANTLDKICV